MLMCVYVCFFGSLIRWLSHQFVCACVYICIQFPVSLPYLFFSLFWFASVLCHFNFAPFWFSFACKFFKRSEIRLMMMNHHTWCQLHASMSKSRMQSVNNRPFHKNVQVWKTDFSDYKHSIYTYAHPFDLTMMKMISGQKKNSK